MQMKLLSRQRPHEQGQTIILVAISLVSLLAMAALAIDIVTLYLASSEIQRAADATALAAAKAIADSGVTTLQATDPKLPGSQTLAQNMATAAVTGLMSAAAVNLVAGATPTLNTITPIPIDWTRQGNPHVTISMRSSNLPTFFSKIWTGTPPSVTATATAEVYNPANVSTFTPIAPLSLKPWLVANVDPNNATPNTPFVTIGTGAVEENVIGEQLNLIADCRLAPPNKCVLRGGHNPPIANHATLEVDYVPLQVSSPPNSKNVCPACASGATDYEQSIACADATTYVTPTCGGGATNAVWSDTFNPRGIAGLSATGTECLINAGGPGPWDGSANLQDQLIIPGPASPVQIKAGSGALAGSLVTTSSSIVTIPIVDTSMPTGSFPSSPGAVIVVGFIQAFINEVNNNAPAGDINVTVLNIAGCSNTDNGANPVIGGSGTSPIPVRLITPP
jgi:putative Flp pilus-assembly TadE/G-like protein